MKVRQNGKKRGFKGFTLVELVVVLAILGVLVALAVPRFTTSAAKAKETTFCSNVRTIKSQLELYKMTTGSYPTTASFVEFLDNKEYFESAPINPYTASTFKENDPGDGNSGKFKYDSTGNATYTITTAPTCNIDNSKVPTVSVSIISKDLEGEKVIIKNNGNTDVDMSDWKLISVVGNQIFTFPDGFILKKGQTVTITSGKNAYSNPPSVLKWTNAYIWNNDGDAAKLVDSEGRVISTLP